MGRPERVLLPKEFAARYRYSTRTVYNLIERGELRAFGPPGLYRIPPDAVEEWEAKQWPARETKSQTTDSENAGASGSSATPTPTPQGDRPADLARALRQGRKPNRRKQRAGS